MKLKNLLSIAAFFWCFVAQAQVTIEPTFATGEQEITVIYDASKGSKGLIGATNVYMHSGVVTSGPTGTDWMHVIGNWGQDNGVGKMTKRADLGADMWSIKLSPTARAYYSVPAASTIYKLAMVFRDATGAKEGKTETNSDFFIPLSQGGLDISFVTPDKDLITPALNETFDVKAKASVTADSIKLFIDGTSVKKVTGVDSITYSITATSEGRKEVKVVAYSSGANTEKKFYYYVVSPPNNAAVPSGIVEGINYVANDSVVLSLYAPGKQNVFFIWDGNDWLPEPKSQLNKDGDFFWIGIGDLEAGKEYNFQYLVDLNIRIGDPYCEKVVYSYDKDQIPASVYSAAELAYPGTKTSGPVSVLQPGKPAYTWKVPNFQAPAQEKLVIYELLVRDFSEAQTFQAVIDSLNYFKKLGVNAIEFMPVKEFPGANSWGYNPAFFNALEKRYGKPEVFKALIDSCHANGIAVILDMVFNHTQEDNPIARMYWDGNKPAANSPWLNLQAPHPYSVFFDFNHEKEATKKFMDIVCKYWLKEYKIDGFRFDLTKGFTQKQSTESTASNYDQSRIDILKAMSSKIWSQFPEAYIILEHFADNSEETALTSHANGSGSRSLMVWGNMHGAFKENILGFGGTKTHVQWSYYGTGGRGWTKPGLVAFMESHDEERQMVDAIKYGNTAGNVRNLDVALQRKGTANALLYAIPGAKMIWQFGELGYDYSINYCPSTGAEGDCRTDLKPVRWDYFANASRRKLYETMAGIFKLKTTYPVFNTTDVFLSDADATDAVNHSDLAKMVKLTGQPYVNNPTTGDQMNVIVMANLDINSRDYKPVFHHTGKWYDYFSGVELNITDVNQVLTLTAGQFRILTDVKVSNGNPLVVVTPPATPTNLAVTEDGITYKLAWEDKSSDETGFAIERREGAGAFAQIGTVAANIRAYTDAAGLQVGKSYSYRVRAIKNTEFSDYSNVATTGEVLSSADEALAKTIQLFPNPSQGELHINMYNDVKGAISIRVTNLVGQVLWSSDFSKGANSFEQTIQLPSLPSGMYLLQVITENGKASKTFFKE